MRRVVLLLSMLMALGGGWPVPASAGDKEQCVYTYLPDSTARQDLIKTCSRLIKSKTLRGEDLARIYNARAFSHYAENQYDQAIADADQVIGTILPHSAQAKMTSDNLNSAYYIRGASYFFKRDYARTIADQTVVLRMHPKVAASQSRGRAYYETGEFDRAIEDFSVVIRDDTQHALAHIYRALSFERKDELAKALADARRASEITPNGFSRMSEKMIDRLERKLAAGGIK